MRSGDFLILGHVLWNYMHDLTRLIRDLLFIEPPGHLINHSIGPTVLTKEQLDDRKYYLFNKTCKQNFKIKIKIIMVYEITSELISNSTSVLAA